jgi:hypothetical protein
MIRLTPLFLAIGITTTSAPTTEPRYFDAVAGTWDGMFRPSIVHINVRVDRERSFTNYLRTYSIDELSGLRREKRAVGFELRRSAGTFRFDGTANDLRAAGTFEFVPNAAFRKTAERIGLKKITRHQQLSFALNDVSIDELRYMKRVVDGRWTSAELARLFDRGVTPEYVRDLAGVGFSKLRPDLLIRSRERGVNADYVRGLRAAGLRLSMEDYIKAHDEGVSLEFINDMKSIGLTNLTLAEYVTLVEHDVTADYAASIYEAGYSNCDLEDLIRMRDYGITATFIKKANKQSGELLSVAELLRFRTRGDY